MKDPILQTHAHPNVSNRYDFISTQEILHLLSEEGWYIAQKQNAKCRVKENEGYQKHCIKLENPNLPSIEGAAWQALLINSHNRTATFKFELGLFVKLCLNGLVVGHAVESMHFRHIKGKDKDIFNRLSVATQQIPQVSSSIRQMKAIELTRNEQGAYAQAVNELVKTPYRERDLLTIRREENRRPTLWNTYNVVQENIIKGHHGRKKITSIDKDIKLNKALYMLAEKMIALKGYSP